VRRFNAIIKIAVIFAMFGKDFWIRYVGVRDYNNSFTVVEGGIPNGGYQGDFMSAIYSFQWNRLAMIVGTLVDPMATLLNANGVSAMLMGTERGKWLSNTLTT
jgi:hypothetical protein